MLLTAELQQKEDKRLKSVASSFKTPLFFSPKTMNAAHMHQGKEPVSKLKMFSFKNEPATFLREEAEAPLSDLLCVAGCCSAALQKKESSITASITIKTQRKTLIKSTGVITRLPVSLLKEHADVFHVPPPLNTKSHLPMSGTSCRTVDLTHYCLFLPFCLKQQQCLCKTTQCAK